MNSSIRSIIKHHSVRLDCDDGQAHAPLPKGRASRSGQKSVELLRVDNKVRAIEITCSCGEKSVVELDYADDKPAAKPAEARTADPRSGDPKPAEPRKGA
ncbi:MAG: hypothetical protein HZA52_15180 [Planctomycetes bacterium]|nr:hypothetical protein [Planctomycetota bacterium]